MLDHGAAMSLVWVATGREYDSEAVLLFDVTDSLMASLKFDHGLKLGG